MTQSHMSASGCFRLLDSVTACLISFAFLIRVSGVSTRGFFSQDLFDAFHSAAIFCLSSLGDNASINPCIFPLLISLYSLSLLSLSFCLLYFSDFLVERDNDYCVCETPCNMTRYGKEMSFVKIPSKASAKYLAKKFNKTEQYIA